VRALDVILRTPGSCVAVTRNTSPLPL
jgi:hypothetical protein